jgi:hypothetical protein
MAKDVTKTAKVLPDLTANAPAAPAKTPAPATGKAKKNQEIVVEYQDKEGKAIPLGDGVAQLKILTKKGEKLVKLSELPRHILIIAAASGLNTTIRNAHNSTHNAGGDGPAAALARASAIMAGDWRTTGEAGEDGVPLVIEAMIKAKKDANAYEEGMEEKWLTAYRGLDKDGKAEWTKTMSAKKPIAVALLQIRAERAALKAQEAVKSAATGGEGDDF